MKNNTNLQTQNNVYIPKQYSFEQQQAMAFAFLKAFYNSQELGYNVDRYKFTDVSQEIIDIVNNMAYQILTTARITAVSVILLKASKIIITAIDQKRITQKDVLMTIFDIINDSVSMSSIGIILGIEENLKKIRDVIRANPIANIAFILILNREKGNIELKFNGF